MKNNIYLILFILFSSISYCQSYGIMSRDANSRRTAGGQQLRVILKGQQVEILQNKGGWSFVRDMSNDKKGWVANSVLSKNINSSTSKPIVVKKAKNMSPNCDYNIISHSNGDNNVNINPTIIKWSAASGNPNGYYISIGSSIKRNEVLKNINIGNVTSYSISDLKPNTKYYISLVPYNKVGFADCDGVFSFTTGSGVASDNKISSEQIIENRLRNMRIFSKWNNFNKSRKSERIKIRNINDFLLEVKSYMGVPYKFSGTTKAGIDCSGLIWKGLRATGYNGERLNAQSLAQSGKLIPNKSDLKPGDLVCFTNTTGAKKLVQHIAIYMGNNEFLHAPSKGKNVMLSDLNDPYYWNDKFIFGVRFN